MKLKIILIVIILLCISVPRVSLASQMAEVEEDEAEIHQLPNDESPLVTRLVRGYKFKVSSKTVKDAEGNLWYRAKIPTFGFGYVLVSDVQTFRDRHELRDAGVGQTAEAEESEEEDSWSFVARVMGLGGYSSDNTTGKNRAIAGGEAEFSVCIPLEAHGYLHRLFSVGGAILILPQEPVATSSFIFRIYSDSLIEPEIRLRFGEGITSSDLIGGINAALGIPLAVTSQTHLAAYVEVGTALTIASDSNSHLRQAWGSAGLGLHF